MLPLLAHWSRCSIAHTQPLLRPRAFLRSALITTGLVAVALYEDPVFRPDLLWDMVDPPSRSTILGRTPLGTNIAVDYVSLFHRALMAGIG